MLQSILKEKKMSVLRCSQASNIPYSTLLDLVKRKTDIKKASSETLYKLSKTLNIPMDVLFERCTRSEPYRSDFEAFKSTVCHLVKKDNDIDFIIKTLESNEIETYWEREWMPECFYLLAMVDYLSRINELPICTKYNYIRQYSLDEPLYPRDVRVIAKLNPSSDIKEKCLQEAIPEFLKFNIIESEIRNVC